MNAAEWQEQPLCPIPGCPRSRWGEMCRNHWSQVDPTLQRKVYSTWRAWRRNFADADKMHAYSYAVERARRDVDTQDAP